MPILGWDLGGAHLKAVLIDETGAVLQVWQLACPLWQGLSHLESAMQQVMNSIKTPVTRHSMTMSGELVDIFNDRHHGVMEITNTFCRLLDVDVSVYAGARGFVAENQVHQYIQEIASANWHASAAWIAQSCQSGLLIDIGSTTADFIPLIDSKPMAIGQTDLMRLKSQELIYTGVVRTPVMAVAQTLPFQAGWCGVAAEYFATMADVYRLTGELDDAFDMAPTADNGDKSIEASARRLARMVGADVFDADLNQWRQLARSVKEAQLTQLSNAALRHLSRPDIVADAPFIGAGAGRFLVEQLAQRLGRDYRDVCELIQANNTDLMEAAAVCFPAYAVAQLRNNS